MINVALKPKSGQPLAKLQMLVDGLDLADKQAAHVGAALVLREAIKRCPHLTGTLKRSGKVVPESPTSKEKIIRFDTPYAARIHEGFKRKDGGNYKLGKKSESQAAQYGVVVGPKFITRAFNENKATVMETINRVYQNLIARLR